MCSSVMSDVGDILEGAWTLSGSPCNGNDIGEARIAIMIMIRYVGVLRLVFGVFCRIRRDSVRVGSERKGR